ncbi:MAG: hypothetical protein WCI27_10865, partial [Candidatus Omnitrophota bacterium]
MLILVFLVSDMRVYAQGVLQLPAPGTRLALSPTFDPPLLKGIKVYRNDPFRFDFILDKGEGKATDEQVKTDSTRLIKYFLASLTVPEKDLWVNLSPYEKDRIVPEAFGQTEMGRDLLAQDYILKQITASVIYPDDKVGKEFWDKVYAEALKRYGTTDIPVDTFNKVWITPEKATVYENKDAAYVVESRLKVMLETDYLATVACKDEALPGLNTNTTDSASSDIPKQILRDVIIPILEKEVNEGQNFATLRQVYNSLVLATWYKRKVKASIMGQAYVDKKKTGGIDIADKDEKEKIWAQYVEAFKKGAFSLIKEERDETTQEIIPRKYFSGGIDWAMDVLSIIDSTEFPNALNVIEKKLQRRDHKDFIQLGVVVSSLDFEMDNSQNEDDAILKRGVGEAYWALVRRIRKGKLDSFKSSQQFHTIKLNYEEKVKGNINNFYGLRFDALLAQGISASDLNSLRLSRFHTHLYPGSDPHIIAVLGGGKPSAFIEDIVADGSFQEWLGQKSVQTLMNKMGVNVFLTRDRDEKNRHTIYYYNYDLMRVILKENVDLIPGNFRIVPVLNSGKEINNHQIDEFFKEFSGRYFVGWNTLRG